MLFIISLDLGSIILPWVCLSDINSLLCGWFKSDDGYGDGGGEYDIICFFANHRFKSKFHAAVREEWENGRNNHLSMGEAETPVRYHHHCPHPNHHHHHYHRHHHRRHHHHHHHHV